MLCFPFLTSDDMTEQEIVRILQEESEVTDGDEPDEEGNL
jgi:hypothetical protein